MPRKIIARQGPTFHLVEYEPPPLGEQDVRVTVEFAAPKHGTEIKGLTSSPFASKRWDPELRLFLPNDMENSPVPPQERSVGNMIVGTVTKVGSDVRRFSAGDRVFGYGPICDLHQTTADRLYPMGDLQTVPTPSVSIRPMWPSWPSATAMSALAMMSSSMGWGPSG
jgi:NADPH:quinone reductase-like Zn-dependent oxidoreductase